MPHSYMGRLPGTTGVSSVFHEGQNQYLGPSSAQPHFCVGRRVITYSLKYGNEKGGNFTYSLLIKVYKYIVYMHSSTSYVSPRYSFALIQLQTKYICSVVESHPLRSVQQAAAYLYVYFWVPCICALPVFIMVNYVNSYDDANNWVRRKCCTNESFAQLYFITFKFIHQLFSRIMTALFSFPRAPSPSPFNTLNPGDVRTPWGPRLGTIGEYFKYLQTPQASCKKLVRMGGTPSCKRNVMDGHKVTNICNALGYHWEQLLHSSLFGCVDSREIYKETVFGNENNMIQTYFGKVISFSGWIKAQCWPYGETSRRRQLKGTCEAHTCPDDYTWQSTTAIRNQCDICTVF